MGFEKKTLIVGLGNRAQQGKDTAAEHIIQVFGKREEGEWGNYFPIDVRRYAFADALKVEVFDWIQAQTFIESNFSATFDLPWEVGSYFWNRSYSTEEKLAWVNRNKGQLRKLLQKWGTEFRRVQDSDYWVKKTLARIREEGPQVALITDMRFLNEAKAVDVTVKVKRPGFVSGVPLHSSETVLDDYPFQYILEATNLEELKEGAETLFVEILEDKGVLPSFQESAR